MEVHQWPKPLPVDDRSLNLWIFKCSVEHRVDQDFLMAYLECHVGRVAGKSASNVSVGEIVAALESGSVPVLVDLIVPGWKRLETEKPLTLHAPSEYTSP